MSDVRTCQSLSSPIFTNSSSANNENFTVNPITLEKGSQEEHEKIVKQKDEIRITGGTERKWTTRTRRRVHSEEVFCLNGIITKKKKRIIT